MPRVLTEAHKQALAAGRRRAAMEKREDEIPQAHARIQAWVEWCKADAACTAQRNSGASPAEAPRPPMPTIPSRNDYRLVGLSVEDTDA